MKLFWVAAWDNYYPEGGLDNVKAYCVTREEAYREYEKLKDTWDNVEIFNISELW